ncbi:MAG: flavin reductase family protein [Candidatus Nezhaarchaeota archaeon]|nr:flavin reductase family protein [Candidatus Nezhaarchaeota archaeon]
MAKVALSRLWEFFRLLYPCQAVLITCAHQGRVNVMTSSALPSSFKPPLLVVSVSPRRLSYELIKQQGEFVVNVPTAELLDKVVLCGYTTGRDVDKFKQLGLTPRGARVVSVPIIEECVAHLECRVFKEVEAGDHCLFIGEVVAAYAEQGLLDKDEDGIALWNIEKANLLLHVGGRFFATPGRVLKAGVSYSFFKG